MGSRVDFLCNYHCQAGHNRLVVMPAFPIDLLEIRMKGLQRWNSVCFIDCLSNFDLGSHLKLKFGSDHFEILTDQLLIS